MKVERLEIPDVFQITPSRIGDARGWFMETYSRPVLKAGGLDVEFVQDNQSFSAAKGTLRGLHFQINPAAQGKLIRVTRGAIRDVAVDIRQSSRTFGRHLHRDLTAENGLQLYIPKGFAHGFLTLTEDVEVCYKVTAPYSKHHDRGIAWDDPALAIPWGISGQQATLSAKDKVLPKLAEARELFP